MRPFAGTDVLAAPCDECFDANTSGCGCDCARCPRWRGLSRRLLLRRMSTRTPCSPVRTQSESTGPWESERAAVTSAPSEHMSVVVFAMAALSAVVTFAWILTLGGVAAPLSPWGSSPQREGIELLVIPLAAASGLLWRSRRAPGSAPLPGRLEPWFPLGGACALALISLAAVLVLLWVAFHSEALTIVPYNILRGVWIACAGLFVCAAALLYPRIAATLIGGFGVPALFGILTLGFPDSVILGLQRGQHCFSLPLRMCTGDEGVFLVAAAAAGGLALVAVAGLAAWLWPRSRVMVNAAIAGAVMLYPAVYGYVFVWATRH